MKNPRASKPILLFALTTFLVTIFVSALSFQSKAAALSDLYVYLSRIETNVAGSSETLEIVLAINTATTIPTGGEVTITFPDGDDGNWCRTAGDLAITAETGSAADLSGTDWAIDAGLPTSSSFTGACTQGSGASSADTIVFDNVGTVTAGTTYGVKIANGTAAGVLGTDDTAGSHDITVEVKNGVTMDSSTVKVWLITNDTVVVSATVSATPSVICSISANTATLGTLYPGGSYAVSSTHTIGTETTGTTAGYYWAAYGLGDGSTDAGLWKSTATTYLIASGSAAALDLTVAGSEGFGMTLSDPDAGGAAVVTTNFVDTTVGTFGTLDIGPAGAKLILYQNGTQLTGADTSTVTYGARASTSAEAGNYQESVTFSCGGYY